MKIFAEWNPKQKLLREIIRKSESFDQAKELFISLHQSTHFSKNEIPTIIDSLWENLQTADFSIVAPKRKVTIAWDIWHITRIEDLTINILVNEGEQILNNEWLNKLQTKVTDTGNAMTKDEIVSFSNEINMTELKNYSIAVGQKTQSILQSLQYEDMKRKFQKSSLDKILNEHGLVEHPDSIWLLDFWGKKDVAGIILMPITRHQSMHLNNSFKIKERLDR